jgi:hypothetical protein
MSSRVKRGRLTTHLPAVVIKPKRRLTQEGKELLQQMRHAREQLHLTRQYPTRQTPVTRDKD